MAYDFGEIEGLSSYSEVINGYEKELGLFGQFLSECKEIVGIYNSITPTGLKGEQEGGIENIKFNSGPRIHTLSISTSDQVDFTYAMNMEAMREAAQEKGYTIKEAEDEEGEYFTVVKEHSLFGKKFTFPGAKPVMIFDKYDDGSSDGGFVTRKSAALDILDSYLDRI